MIFESRLLWFIVGAVAVFVYDHWDAISTVQQHQQQISGAQEVYAGIKDLFGGMK